ncbi:MAG: Nif3-like dinuclear metal center hexameric protein [Eubacteriales bacterium]
MPVKCQTIISLIERLAPKSLAEDWDNVGIQVGDQTLETGAVLVSLDLNPQVVSEALSLGANLVVTHHPVIFKPLKNIRADLPMGRMLTDIIKNDIVVYSAHTNLDSAGEGVNQVLAELLELEEIQVLNPEKSEKLYKIVVFIPDSHANDVGQAMTKAGAGWIGNYSDCTFSVKGKGTFKATEGCSPFIGQVGILEETPEIRLETVVKENQVNRVIKAMVNAHPYEEVAYDLYPLANKAGELGLGRVGRLKQAIKLSQFMDLAKKLLKVAEVRYCGDLEAEVRKIAVCGGSGASLIHKASFAGADVFLTGDIKYHEAQEAAALGLNLVDAGHFATENPVVEKLAQYLESAFAVEGFSVPVYISKSNYDVVRYY